MVIWSHLKLQNVSTITDLEMDGNKSEEQEEDPINIEEDNDP